MLVKNWMSRPVVTIDPKASMQIARDLMDRNNIHALPVVDDDRLVGLLTDRALKRAEASDATTLDAYELQYLLQKVTVTQIMTPNPITVAFDATLSEAADLFLEHQLEAAPVMAGEDQVAGVLTSTDLERAILKLTSFARRGIQFGIRVSDTPGAVMDVVAAVRDVRARLASLLTTDASEGDATREIYIHIYGVNRARLPELLGNLGRKGTLLYMVDFKSGERQLFNR